MVRLIKYLRGIIDYNILYSEFLAILKKYNNTNWILESNNIKSGFIFIINDGAMSSKSCQQNGRK